MLGEIQAEQQLLAIEAASVPHMDASSRGKVLGRLGRMRQRGRQFRSAAEALASLPIPVRRIPKEVQRGR